MNDPILEAENEKYYIEIYPDNHAENPRDYETLGTIISSHPHIGDETNLSREEIENRLESLPESAVILPVYKYEHGQVALNTSGFDCPWDSGQIGYIYADMNSDNQSYDDPDVMKDLLRNEIKIYSQYINGNVYGYVLYLKNTCTKCDKEHKEQTHSCSGFYGIGHESTMNDHLPDDAQVELSTKGLSFK